MKIIQKSPAISLIIAFLAIQYSAVFAAPVILNEYNAVSGSRQLDEGLGADTFFGTIDGNGGNWFELLVIDDHTDMRGWRFDWNEDETVGAGEETATGSITLSQDAIWSDLRSGSIITIIETPNADGAEGFDTSTDTSYDPQNGDWWINVATQQEQAKGAAGLLTTTTNDGVAGDFSVGNDDWTLEIFDSTGSSVFGPVGEGAADWPGGNINNEEAGSLEVVDADGVPMILTLEEWKAITPATDFYDDTGSTSFGGANVDYNDLVDPPVFVVTQDLSALRDPVLNTQLKSGDFDGDEMLTANDINLLTAAVGIPAPDEKFDVNSDGAVNQTDRELWVNQIKNSYFGDSNLDGEFNSSDFVEVFRAGEYEDETDGNSLWEEGDWNGDGDFNTRDFVAAFQAGGYERGPRQAQSVPEPGSMLFVIPATFLVALLRRKEYQ